MIYENRRMPLAPVRVYYSRILRNLLIGSGILLICLAIGIIGYHLTAHIGWLDSLHNASMILSGMGPVVSIETEGGKIFSSFYALFSGVVFITNISFILAPAVHRFFHKLHVEEK
jgi:hypothetical protein